MDTHERPHMRTFAYCRVSTVEQSTDNQLMALEAAGYTFEPSRVVSEVVSGGVMAMEREGFRLLVEHKLEHGDKLVVLKLDRLGRDTIDVLSTIELLRDKDVAVESLDLRGVDLASPAGKLQLTVLAAVAEMEKGRIRERTREGLERAKASGKRLGRHPFDRLAELQELKAQGLSQGAVVKQMGVSLSTVKRNWNK